jgi:hypothetical protein
MLKRPETAKQSKIQTKGKRKMTEPGICIDGDGITISW